MGTEFQTLSEVLPAPTYQYEDGDEERFAHYVKKDKILDSAISGKPVRALCGKKWVPTRDPERFPLCPICKKIYDQLPK